jgi:hypothetical protein
MTILAQNGKIWVPTRDIPPIVQKVLNTPARVVFGVLSLLFYTFTVLEIIGIIPGIAIKSSYKVESHKAVATSTEPSMFVLILVASCVVIASACLAVALNSIDAQTVFMLSALLLLFGGFFYANINYIPAVKIGDTAMNELYQQETGEHENIARTAGFNLDNKATVTTKDGSIYIISVDNKNSTRVYSIKELEPKNS